MSQFHSRQTTAYYPPPQGPEDGEYIEYEYEEDYDDEVEGDSFIQRVLIFLSGGCLVFLCMGCCLFMVMGAVVLNPTAGLLATPIPGGDIGLTFEAPAFPDESVVNEEKVQLTIVEVNRNVTLPDFTPVEGRELVVLTVELLNLGDEEAGYSESEFLLVNEFEEAYQVSPAAASVEGALGRGALAPGEGIEGRLMFDILTGELNLILAWEGGREALPRYIFIE